MSQTVMFLLSIKPYSFLEFNSNEGIASTEKIQINGAGCQWETGCDNMIKRPVLFARTRPKPRIYITDFDTRRRKGYRKHLWCVKNNVIVLLFKSVRDVNSLDDKVGAPGGGGGGGGGKERLRQTDRQTDRRTDRQRDMKR